MSTATDWLSSPEVDAWCRQREAENKAEAAFVAVRKPELLRAYVNDTDRVKDALSDAASKPDAVRAFMNGKLCEFLALTKAAVVASIEEDAEYAAGDEFWKQYQPNPPATNTGD